MSNVTSTGRAVILTAIEVEFMAVREHLSDIHEEVYHGSIYDRGNFSANGRTWDVLIGQVGAGNSASAAAVERAIAYFAPEVILFVGVAGGVKDAQIGDVVAVTKAYGYESGKVHDTGFLVRPEVGMSSFRLTERAKAEARKKNWLQRIAGSAQVPVPAPRALVGPIAAGEKVIASTSNDLFQFLQKNYNDTLAVEMEGRGFLEAARANEHVQALIIRGISDLLDNKNKYDAQGSQEKASSHAAAFAFEVLAQLDSSRQPAKDRPGETSEPVSPLPSPSKTAQALPSLPLEIYYSFAHVREDEVLVEQLKKQLAVLRSQNRISEWDLGKVFGGQEVRTEVTKHLNAARIILLFFSSDYMASDACMYESSRAMERHESQVATVIPILLRPVAMLEETPFAKIQGYPKNGRAISELGNRKQAAFAEIAGEISAIVKKFS
ncbi:MAG TPA: toll/interleukin-1 receptor domain-containing protein [Ktedonobacteraceae bacterium]|nr:toll/interleukin-1 receptor domain-containing protein [Ktedonobacteraceae bacterium]